LAEPLPAPVPPDPQPHVAHISRELAVLLAAVVSYGFAHSTYFLLPKYLELELHANPAQIGWYAAATWIVTVGLAGIAGAWIDRRGRRPFAFAGAALLAVTCAGFLFVKELGPLLLLLRLLHGVSFTFFFVATQTLAADIAAPEHLGRTIGYYGSAFVFTNAAAPSAAEWLAERAGWPSVFLATTVLAVFALAMLVPVHERRPPPSADGAPVPGVLDALFRPGFLRLMSVAALAGVAFAAAFTFNQPFALSLGIKRVSDFFVAYSITAVIVRGPFGSWADRAGRLRVTRYALVVYAIASFASIQLESLGLVVTGVLFGIAHGLFYPALNAASLEGAGAELRAKLTGLFNAGFNAGFSLGALGLGFVALHYGYAHVFALAGVCCVAALGLVPRARQTETPWSRSEPEQ
jgi:MFS family permease